MNTESLIIVGKLGSSYGIRGWIRVFSFTQNPENIFDYSPWYIKRSEQFQEIIVESYKPHNHDMIVKLKQIDDRDQANALTNFEVYVDAKNLPELSDGDFYWKDLIGCTVKNINGYDLGQVIDLMETGSNDVLVVKANLKDAFGASERLIPFVVEQYIKHVDLTTKTIQVDWDPAF